MRLFPLLLLPLVLAAPLSAQGSNAYENEELALSFSGIYGWDATFASGAGGWSTLATYREDALDATVRVQVASNPYASFAEMSEALRRQFADGGEPTEDAPVYKEIEFSEAAMRKGAKLPGVEIRGYRVSIDEEGKKREDRILLRTWYGQDRLYRVFGEVRRSRARRVEDLLVRALNALTVESGAAKPPRVFAIRSEAGRYRVAVPVGFDTILPAGGDDEPELRFESNRGRVRVELFALPFDGILDDQLDVLFDRHGGDIRLESDEVRVLGEPGFRCTIERGDMLTLVSGTIHERFSYRVHTTFHRDRTDEATQAHEAFLKAIELEK